MGHSSILENVFLIDTVIIFIPVIVLVKKGISLWTAKDYHLHGRHCVVVTGKHTKCQISV